MFIDRDRGRFYFIFKTLFRFKTCPRKGKVVRVDKIYTKFLREEFLCNFDFPCFITKKRGVHIRKIVVDRILPCRIPRIRIKGGGLLFTE